MATYITICQQLIDLCKSEHVNDSLIKLLEESKIEPGFFLDKTDIEEQYFILSSDVFTIVNNSVGIFIDKSDKEICYYVSDIDDVNHLYMLEKMFELVCRDLPNITLFDWYHFITILHVRKDDWLIHKINSNKSGKWLVVHNDMSHYILTNIKYLNAYSAIAKYNGEKYAYVFKFCVLHRNNNMYHQAHYNNIYYKMTGHDPNYKYEIVLTNDHLLCEYEYFPEHLNYEEHDPYVIHYYYDEVNKKICQNVNEYVDNDHTIGEIYVIELNI